MIAPHRALALVTFVCTVSASFALAYFMTPNLADATGEACEAWTYTSGPPASAKKKVREDVGFAPMCYGKGNQCKDWITMDPTTGRSIVNCEIDRAGRAELGRLPW
jgi:hypothetical protein